MKSFSTTYKSLFFFDEKVSFIVYPISIMFGIAVILWAGVSLLSTLPFEILRSLQR